MPKRRCGMHSKNAGLAGVLDMRPTPTERKRHPADGASVKLITNRYSGIEVEVTKDHGIYSRGSRLIVRPFEFLTGEWADLKRMMGV